MKSKGTAERTLRELWDDRARPLDDSIPPNQRDALTAAAVRRADRGGLTKVSFAVVAGELNLDAGTLYRYVDSKAELVDLMVDHAIGPAPALPAGEWRPRVRAWVVALVDQSRRHPWLGDVPRGGTPRFPNRISWFESLLDELDRGRVADPMRIALLLDALARTFALAERAVVVDGLPDGLLGAMAEKYPRFATELTRDWSDADGELDGALEIVLRGVDATVARP